MSRRSLYYAVLAACTLLGACGQADTDPGPGGLSVGEARALDQAAEMLDQQRLPAEALQEPDVSPQAEGEAERADGAADAAPSQEALAQ